VLAVVVEVVTPPNGNPYMVDRLILLRPTSFVIQMRLCQLEVVLGQELAHVLVLAYMWLIVPDRLDMGSSSS
jgi:hypothetical protein